MSWLKKKTQIHHWEETIVHDDPYEVTDWHATAQSVGPKLILGILVLLGFIVTKGPYPLVFVGFYLLALLGDYIMSRWGKWIRLIGWGLLIYGLYWLINTLGQLPVPPAQ